MEKLTALAGALYPESEASKQRKQDGGTNTALFKYTEDMHTFERAVSDIATKIVGAMEICQDVDLASMQYDNWPAIAKLNRGWVESELQAVAKGEHGGIARYLDKMANYLTDSAKTDINALTYPGDPPIDYEQAHASELKALSQDAPVVVDALLRARHVATSNAAARVAYAVNEPLSVKMGRLHAESTISAAVRSSGDQVQGGMNSTGRTEYELCVAYEALKLSVVGNVARSPETEGRAVGDNAMLAQLYAGRALTGQVAPGAYDYAREAAALSLFDQGSVSTPVAAASAMLTSLYGWLLHMRAISTKPTEKRTFKDWVESSTYVAKRGFWDNEIVSGISIADAEAANLTQEASTLDAMWYRDDEGRLATATCYAYQLSVQQGIGAAPGVRSGYYLLTIPVWSANQDSLTAAAMAMTYQRPRLAGASGNFQLMALANTCNVSYVAGVGASARSLQNGWSSSVAFGPTEVITLMGALVKNNLTLSQNVVSQVTYSIASLFAPATRSHHDYTDVLGAGVLKLAHPFCEPAADMYFNTKTNKAQVDVDVTAEALGTQFTSNLATMISVMGTGRSLAEIAIAQRGTEVLDDGDVSRLQRDHAAMLINMGLSDEPIESIAKALKTVGASSTVSTELGAINLAAMGAKHINAAASGYLWPVTAVTRSPGCAYVRQHGRGALTKVKYRDGEYQQNAVEEIMAHGAGNIATIDGAGATTRATEFTAHVTEAREAGKTEMEALAENLWRSKPTVLFAALKALESTNALIIRKPSDLLTAKPYLAAKLVQQDARDDQAIITCVDKTLKIDEKGAKMGDWIKVVRSESKRNNIAKSITTATGDMAEKQDLLLSAAAMVKMMLKAMDAKTTHRARHPIRQAIAIGWWHGAYVDSAAKWYAKNPDGGWRQAINRGHAALTTVSPNQIENCTGTCAFSSLINDRAIRIIIADATGRWTTLGRTIVGGAAVPAALRGWQFRRADVTNEVEGRQQTIHDVISNAAEESDALLLKLSTTATRSAAGSVVDTKRGKLKKGIDAISMVTYLDAQRVRLVRSYYSGGEHGAKDRLLLHNLDRTEAAKALPVVSTTMQQSAAAVAQLTAQINALADGGTITDAAEAGQQVRTGLAIAGSSMS
ncbi:coat protein subunit p2 [Rugonectria rugulosa quadrivirus 1]|nr:coat protein subunit p2 [Rugonectria rugulosa quadrivirus 1]